MSELTWARAARAYATGGSVTAPSVPIAPMLNATVVSVHDGDTATLDIDRLLGDSLRTPVRLLGCNAIELSQPGGKEARDNLAALLPVGTQVVIQKAGNDKFGGRIDSAVTFLLDGQPTDLVGYLCAQGWAAPWDGIGKAPLPAWPRTVSA